MDRGRRHFDLCGGGGDCDGLERLLKGAQVRRIEQEDRDERGILKFPFFQ